MTPRLYGSGFSPVVRSTLLTIRALGIEVEMKEVNTRTGDHLKPEFLALNPLHTIPTLEDGNFVVWDSHAINAFLTAKYGKDDSLYPKDLEKRAVIDQRLYFDCGVLFIKLRNVVIPIFKEGAKSVPKEAAESLIEGKDAVAVITLALQSCITAVSNIK